MKMNSPIKILGIAVLATAFVGTAFAAGGGGGVTGSFQSRDIKGGGVTGTTIRTCPMMKPVYKIETVSNPKINTTYRRLVGYRHEGCVGTNIANMKCAGSKVTCASMLGS